MMEVLTTNERTSSIAVDENAKGQYSFKVKIYFNDGEDSIALVIGKIKSAYDDLHETFGD